MRLAFLTLWTERFDFRVLDVAAQNISQSDDIRTREFVQTIVLSIACVNAQRMCPSRTVLGERGEQGKLQLVTRSRMQDKSERASFAFHLVQIMRRRYSHFH